MRPARERDAVFQRDFREDLAYWVITAPRIANRILSLVEAVLRDPFTGIGKPEPLKGLGSDVWSRRITAEHRLVYLVGGSRIDFVQCRYHY
ncbi:MAG TPA: Txe/YoeB family addiction module toxin [Tepidiformaceae bacterium]|nr:Txe/YoeB family addiction module toxin [Tepidiformaceae bacterium]